MHVAIALCITSLIYTLELFKEYDYVIVRLCHPCIALNGGGKKKKKVMSMHRGNQPQK